MSNKRSGGLDEAVPLIEEFEHALAAPQIDRIGRQFEPPARPRQVQRQPPSAVSGAAGTSNDSGSQ